MRLLLGILIIIIGLSVLFKGSSRYVAFGYNWHGNSPIFTFGSGKAFAAAMRDDSMTKEALKERLIKLIDKK